MIRDGENHDARYEDEPARPTLGMVARLQMYWLFGVSPPADAAPEPEPEPEPVAPWNDLEHAYHEHDARL